MKWKLARLSGIDVFVHWTFWILPLWILSSAISGGGGLLAGLSSVVFVFAIFGCVVLHEMGHALAARHYAVRTRDITLYPIGGVASLERMPEHPVQELVIAIAGPAVNVIIAAALFFGTTLGFGTTAWLASSLEGGVLGGNLLAGLMWVNIALVIFNMLPAFPMDGGRVLRALLAMVMPYPQATSIAGRIGQAMAILLGILGLFTSASLILVAAFVFLAASAELARSAWMQRRATVIPDDDGIVWISEPRSPHFETWVVSPRPSNRSAEM